MTKFGMIAALSVAGLGGIAFSNTEAAAGPIVPPGHYCMVLAGEDITDCGFTSHAQCEASASGLDGECYGPPATDDRSRFLQRLHR